MQPDLRRRNPDPRRWDRPIARACPDRSRKTLRSRVQSKREKTPIPRTRREAVPAAPGCRPAKTLLAPFTSGIYRLRHHVDLKSGLPEGRGHLGDRVPDGLLIG